MQGPGIGYLGLGRASRTARRRSLQTVDGGIRHMVTGTGLIFRLRGRYGTALGAKLFRRAGVPALIALWRSHQAPRWQLGHYLSWQVGEEVPDACHRFDQLTMD